MVVVEANAQQHSLAGRGENPSVAPTGKAILFARAVWGFSLCTANGSDKGRNINAPRRSTGNHVLGEHYAQQTSSSS